MNAQMWLGLAKKVNPLDEDEVFNLLNSKPRKVWKRYQKAVEKWYQRLGGMALFHVELERQCYAMQKQMKG